MANRFIKCAQKPTLHMVNVEIEGSKVWAECTPAVKTYALNNFKEGEEIDFEFSTSKDEKGKVKYKIEGYIKKAGSGDYEQNNTSASSNSQSSKVPSENSSYNKDDRIRSQTLAKATATTIAGLAGHVDLNNVGDIIKEVYKAFDEVTLK